jgi:hypothetical protein
MASDQPLFAQISNNLTSTPIRTTAATTTTTTTPTVPVPPVTVPSDAVERLLKELVAGSTDDKEQEKEETQQVQPTPDKDESTPQDCSGETLVESQQISSSSEVDVVTHIDPNV